jgi:tetratricopeptide (TPR) repeat protein
MPLMKRTAAIGFVLWTGVCLAGAPLPVHAQEPARAPEEAPATPPSNTPAMRPEAAYEFLLGRFYESRGDIDKAIAAHREAARLDPGSAEIRAELASLFARQGRVRDAVNESRAALAIDPENREANRVLGSILASDESASAGTPALDEAVERLERGRRPDGVDADLSLDITLARLYIRAGKSDEAVRLLNGLLARDAVPEAYLLLAQAHSSLGNEEAATDALDAGAQLNPRLYLPLADLYERQQKFDKAASAFEHAVKANPQSIDLKTRWAESLLNRQGESGARQARELLEPIAKQTTDGRVLYLLSQAQRRTRDLDAAEATARRVIALDPKGLWGPFALAQVYEDRHAYSSVVDTLSAAVSEWTPGPGAPARVGAMLLSHLGFAQLQLGRNDDAAATFERAKSVSKDSSIDLYLAQAYLSGRQYDRAIAVLEPLQKKSPDDLRIAQLQARALTGAGRNDDAVNLLKTAVNEHADNPSAYLTLADVLSESSRSDEAQQVLDEAARRFPDNVSVPFQSGALYERAHDYARAETAFRAALARDPQHAPTLNYLGYMLAERGERLDEAVDLIGRALSVDPDNGSYLDSLGWAYFMQREYEKARDHVARAAEQMPSNSVVQDHLGDVLNALGRHAEAIAAWQRALVGDGESIDKDAIRRKIELARSRTAR